MREEIKIIILCQREVSYAKGILEEIADFLTESGYYRVFVYPEHKEIYVHTDYWVMPPKRAVEATKD